MTSWLVKSLIIVVMLVAIGSEALAQQTIFNVPSPDVLKPGGLYFETDHYLRTHKTQHDSPGFLVIRCVFGIGFNAETGFNLGALEYGHASQPFIDASIKWRPLRREFGRSEARIAVGLIVGDNVGVGVGEETAGRIRSLTYLSSFLEFPRARTRISAGPYFATRNVFTDSQRPGAQMTFEQTVPGVKGLVFATDWFSGHGAYATPGFIWSVGRLVIYAGYGFSNEGRQDDLVTLEFGFSH